MKKTMILLGALALILITACTQQETSNEIDLDSLPDEPQAPTGMVIENSQEQELPKIIATINDENIKRDELLNFQRQMNSQGLNLNLNETLNQLLNRKILVQEAKNRGYNATINEVENLLSQQGFSLEDTKELLEAQDINYEEYLNSQLDEILFIKMIENEKKNIMITENESKQFFEEQKHLLDENTTYEDNENKIIETLKEQKAITNLSNLIDELMQTEDIQVYI